jgi:sugar transferase (PEP-CTERM system associated)
MGLYQAHIRERTIGILLRFIAGFVLGSILLSLVFYLLPTLYLGRGVLGLAGIFALVALFILRLLFFKLVNLETLKSRVLVLGAGERASLIIKRMRRRSDRRGFSLVGFLPMPGSAGMIDANRQLSNDASLAALAHRHEIDEIVVALDDRRETLPMNELLECKLAGIKIVDLHTFFERETGAVPLEYLDSSWLIFSDGFRRSLVSAWSKRMVDIAFSLVLLLLLWPVLLITALAIMFDDGWDKPVVYRQQRVGEAGSPFSLAKFRSMRVDAEKDGPVWAGQNDHRVTRVGAVIRKFRIDELPQLFNVLRGDMSFVGPRPERPEFVRDLDASIVYYRERHTVKPGITGWAQLCYPYGASERDAREKLKFDLYYVKNRGLFFDLFILLQTVEVVLFGKGAR